MKVYQKAMRSVGDSAMGLENRLAMNLELLMMMLAGLTNSVERIVRDFRMEPRSAGQLVSEMVESIAMAWRMAQTMD